MEKRTFTCLLCGRDKFSYVGQPHNCVHGFTKHFKKKAAAAGIPYAFKENPRKTEIELLAERIGLNL